MSRRLLAGSAYVSSRFVQRPALDALEDQPDQQVGLGLVGGFAADPPYD